MGCRVQGFTRSRNIPMTETDTKAHCGQKDGSVAADPQVRRKRPMRARTLKGGGAAGVATLGAAGVEVALGVLTETQSTILPLVPYLDTLR